MRADRHVRSFAAVSFMRAAAYARGGDGGNQCPTRYYRIVNKAACENAAAAAGERFDGTDSASYLPSGCVYSQGQGVRLNTHPTGSGYPGVQLLCSGATLLTRQAYTSRLRWWCSLGTEGAILGTQYCPASKAPHRHSKPTNAVSDMMQEMRRASATRH